MSVSLDTMVDYLQAATGSTDDTYEAADYHRAIIAAGNHYLGRVRPASQTTTVSVGSGVSSVDVTATIMGFTQHDLFGQTGYINNNEVKLVGYQKIARRLADSPDAGRPERMAFLADNALYFDRATDQAYSLVLPHIADLTTFTPGTGDNPTLNLPAADAAQLAYTGGVWYLLKGQYDEANETNQAWLGFQQLLKEAQLRHPSSAAAVRDRQVKQ